MRSVMFVDGIFVPLVEAVIIKMAWMAWIGAFKNMEMNL